MTAYIWDLDGTLLDSYGVIVEAAARTAADEGINDPKDYILKVVKQKSCTAYMEEIGSQCGKTVREVFAQYQKHTHALDDLITLIDGAKETLERLQEAGAVHFVYTHRGSSSEPILERLGVLKCFREVVTSMYGFAPKPSGEGVRFLVEKYGLDPEQTWYVGDRTLDVYCAKDAGVKALLFLAPDTCVEATGQEDRIVKDLREI
ncbi:HAD-IA family hydrolase [Aristaeella hokkaidonensis]|uniref:HAD-IA family hydrolase n=1 Tax=Aristaeella hokkaidonensis TaxID=3046382 RepID=A0AC61MWB9_9FIRM|nr:HAD-IA family hydrolase [Aristaeella hokkaidonensis]QUC67029.1 HAD-IA family hydrolase [Aristaeella hokkaidonensis]SNT93662.1 haloacid dehalogenase superfamily, subfamily IA, variant 1 with third motif having Dx(3-4)D or Dx(3-4)E [Aristaeella hokkaidonensis]